jgi:PAS domain S-box-containing protein
VADFRDGVGSQERRESDWEFRTFAQAMPNQAWAVTTDGQLDWFNDQALSYCGLLFGDLAGERWASIVHPDDIGAAVASWSHSLKTGHNYEMEFRLRRADGAYRWHIARAVPIRDTAGNITRWIGTNTDIEDQKAAVAALRELNTDLERRVIERTQARGRTWQVSPDLMGALNSQGYFETSNPAWQSMLGWSEAEVAGMSIFELLHPDDIERTRAGFELTQQGQPAIQFPNRYRCKNGTYRWISWVGVPEDGMVYCSGRDITSDREKEAELAQTQEALRQSQKMEAVGQLTGGIAHDFNNLLQGISGSLDRIQSRIAEGRVLDIDRFLKGAIESTHRAAALTHRLLAFSRRQTLDPKPTDANKLIGGMEDLIRRTMGPNVSIEVVGAGGLWPIKVDAYQLESALLNLCINARDAMPNGGKLTIETANKWLDDRAAKERELPAGQYVSLCVTDTGTGMDPEVIARAFDPFFTTKPLGQGTGLGLSMIYGFARQSGGQVRIYSEIDKGTTMCLYFPLHTGAFEESEPVANEMIERGFGETVLVVDDEQLVRMLIAEVLTDRYYRVIEAADGASALKVLDSSQRIDLMITDVGLPGGMNGRQIADAARVRRKHLKVLFITGYAENAVVGNGHLDAGMEILAKPFAMTTLGNKVREMIES